LVVLTVALAACAHAGDSTALDDAVDPDRVFVDHVRAETINFDDVSDADIINGAFVACDGFGGGYSAEYVVEQIWRYWRDVSPRWRDVSSREADDLMLLVEAGVDAYCPRHLDELAGR
jgi:hypothetical protein